MAIVMLALNGVGLGHLVRATIVCQALQSAGERPIIFSQGHDQPDGASQFPGRYVPSLWRASDDVRRQVASDLHSMAGISLPAVVVEDTHPNPIRLPSYVRRVLMVRPTSFEYLWQLNQNYGAIYDAFVLCDAPGSPSWPYTQAQTDAVNGWERWFSIGPIYRCAGQADIEEVRRRFDITLEQRVCVFTMGGGGVQRNNDSDIERFRVLSLDVAEQIRRLDRSARFIFVKGPYVAEDLTLPPDFLIVDHEPRMAALLASAHGAVIRAGFNTMWECLVGQTPFLPLIGSTFGEPVAQRVSNLEARGLIPADVESFWNAGTWRDAFRRESNTIVETHRGEPEARLLQRLITGGDVGLPAAHYHQTKFPVSRRVYGRPLTRRKHGARLLTIRVDDVTVPEDTLLWLLGLLASRHLCASLEVVPYLMRIDEECIDRFDSRRRLFEVSQHGYAHVPRTTRDNRRYEFDPKSVSPTESDDNVIHLGNCALTRRFPNRFTGGFSSPFDAMPAWLPAAWHRHGGAFVSFINAHRVAESPVPLVHAGIDIWNWAEERALRRDELRKRLEQQLVADGHVGIVLHPRCLRTKWERHRLVSVLNFLQNSDLKSTSLRALAIERTVTLSPVRHWAQAFLRRLRSASRQD